MKISKFLAVVLTVLAFQAPKVMASVYSCSIWTLDYDQDLGSVEEARIVFNNVFSSQALTVDPTSQINLIKSLKSVARENICDFSHTYFCHIASDATGNYAARIIPAVKDARGNYVIKNRLENDNIYKFIDGSIIFYYGSSREGAQLMVKELKKLNLCGRILTQ